jgi:HAD superfamily hydrolase (TIGR01450 family)
VARLVDLFDSVLFDLDGVVYLGSEPIPFAVETINRLSSEGVKVGYVTNNSSRRPEVIADQLQGFGLLAEPGQVIGSARAGAKMLAERVPPGSKVLVVGGEGLRFEVELLGFEIVSRADDNPAAVIQGFAPDVGWTHLAEAAFAIQRGALWLATNQDWTIPREGGIAPGNGTLVSAVHTAVGILPDFAGKPFAPIFQSALDQLGVAKPLFVGDRLDTDIRGANNFGMASACVLTGVASRRELIGAREEDRPDFIISDLRDLLSEYQRPREVKRGLKLGGVQVELLGTKVLVSEGDPRSIEALKAATQLIWSSSIPIYGLEVEEALYSKEKS